MATRDEIVSELIRTESAAFRYLNKIDTLRAQLDGFNEGFRQAHEQSKAAQKDPNAVPRSEE